MPIKRYFENKQITVRLLIVAPPTRQAKNTLDIENSLRKPPPPLREVRLRPWIRRIFFFLQKVFFCVKIPDQEQEQEMRPETVFKCEPHSPVPVFSYSFDNFGCTNLSFYTGHETSCSVKFSKMTITFEPLMQF